MFNMEKRYRNKIIIIIIIIISMYLCLTQKNNSEECVICVFIVWSH